MTTGLRLENVRIWRDDTLLVDLRAEIAPGEVLTIMGPSGSGKSTLLNYVVGQLPTGFCGQGRVVLDGRNVTSVPTMHRRIGLLFQDAILFPHLDVGGNLAFALPRKHRGRALRRRRVDEALERAGLSGHARRDPATLSGGQRARVALMRTLLAEPRAVLLDEPFSALDETSRDRLRRFVFERARELGVPVLLVTHDRADAIAAGARVMSPLGEPLDPRASPFAP